MTQIKWIDVSKELPADDSTVLIWWLRAEVDDVDFGFKPGIAFGKYLHKLQQWRPIGGLGNYNDEVTHWALIPNGPGGYKRGK